MKYIAFAFASAIALSGACAAGSITGTVNGSDGSGITAGVVTARLAATAVSSRPGSGIMSSEIQSDGTFQFPSLAQGVYTVCTEAPLTVWLSSCEWGNNGATVSLTEDQPSAIVSIILAKGAAISVRVNDANGLLAANEGTTPGAHLLIGIGLDNLAFRSAPITSRDSGGRTYQVVVPFDHAVQISIASALFRLSNMAGAALAKFGNLIPVSVPSGQQPPTLTFSVTGIVTP